MENFEDFILPEDQRNKFTEEYKKQNIPSDLEGRTVQELKRRGLLGRPSTLLLKPAFSILIIGILFTAGFYLGRNSSHAGNAVTDDNFYLLLLYNPPNAIQSKSHAKEYGEWFHSLDSKAAGGDELKSEGWSLTTNNKPTPINALENSGLATGYFIIHANSDAEALSLAANCPHLKYNGKIEVRPIQTHN